MARSSLRRKVSVLVLAVVAVAGVVMLSSGADGTDDKTRGSKRGCTLSIPYRSGSGGYASYRIPAVVRTRAGALLAFAEGRVGGREDSGDIDVVVRRSRDGGCTWGPLKVVVAGRGTPGAIRRRWSIPAPAPSCWSPRTTVVR